MSPAAGSCERVVVTGVGLVTSLGTGVDATWSRLVRGESGIGPQRRFEAPPGACAASAEVSGLQPPADLRVPKLAKFMGRATACAVLAAMEAVRAARVEASAMDPYRLGIATATGETGLDYEEFFPSLSAAWDDRDALDFAAWGGRASRLIDPYFALKTLSNATAALLAIEIGAMGPSTNFVQGATAGAHAIAAARDDLIDQRADVVIVAGGDALLSSATWLALARAGRLSRLAPDRACRPFDREADGFVPGEAGAALVLEREGSARARGTRALGEVAGTGFAIESADGEAGALPAMSRAVAALGPGPVRPAFAIAHGESSPAADDREAADLAATFGATTPVTALAGALGYVGAATSVVQVVVALAAMGSRLLPPIARCECLRPGPPISPVIRGPLRLEPCPSCDAVCLARNVWDEHAAVLVRGAIEP